MSKKSTLLLQFLTRNKIFKASKTQFIPWSWTCVLCAWEALEAVAATREASKDAFGGNHSVNQVKNLSVFGGTLCTISDYKQEAF